MVHREIELDEESDRILTDLAVDYDGDPGRALSDLLHSHQGLDLVAEESELVHAKSLAQQKERSEEDFREGRVTTWAEVKRQHGIDAKIASPGTDSPGASKRTR